MEVTLLTESTIVCLKSVSATTNSLLLMPDIDIEKELVTNSSWGSDVVGEKVGERVGPAVQPCRSAQHLATTDVDAVVETQEVLYEVRDGAPYATEKPVDPSSIEHSDELQTSLSL